MNRRSIFKLLAGAACAAAIELTGVRPLVAKVEQYVVNPAYETAEYESVFIFNPEALKSLMPVGTTPSASPAISRFDYVNGAYVEHKPYIAAS